MGGYQNPIKIKKTPKTYSSWRLELLAVVLSWVGIVKMGVLHVNIIKG